MSLSAKYKKPKSFAKTVFADRRKKFLQYLPNSVAIVCAGNPDGNLVRQFCPQSNFFYLTGLEEPYAIAILSTVPRKPKYTLFWKETDSREAIWDGSRPDLKAIKNKSAANKVYSLDQFPKLLGEYIEGAQNIFYTFNVDAQMDSLLLQVRDSLLKQIMRTTSGAMVLSDLNTIMEELRICKQDEEIAIMQQAADITAEAYRQAMHTAKAGMFEYEVEALLHYIYRKHGAQGPSFPSIVASGENSTILHYSRNDRRLTNNDLLLVDSGVCYGNYCSDVTRTWPVSGKFSAAQKAVYQAVLTTQKQLIDQVRPGITIKKIHENAVRLLTIELKNLGILAGSLKTLLDQRKYEPFYMHKTCHWLGLEVHDIGGWYRKSQPRQLMPGMILTIEPGLYIRNQIGVPKRFHGIGVRIEDDVLVTKDGCRVLTAAIPKEIISAS